MTADADAVVDAAEEAARFHTLLTAFEGIRPPPAAGGRTRSTSR